jgi:hypothetical protein
MTDTDGELLILTLQKVGGGGRYVSMLLDEAVSDQPDFLVAVVAEMKGRLSGEIPTVVPGAPLFVPEEIRAIPKEVQERVDAEVREQLSKIPGSALYKRPPQA